MQIVKRYFTTARDSSTRNSIYDATPARRIRSQI